MFKFFKRNKILKIEDAIKFMDKNYKSLYLISIIRKSKHLKNSYVDIEMSRYKMFKPVFNLRDDNNYEYAVVISLNNSFYKKVLVSFKKSDYINRSIHIKEQKDTYLIPCIDSEDLIKCVKYLLNDIFNYQPNTIYKIQTVEVKKRTN